MCSARVPSNPGLIEVRQIQVEVYQPPLIEKGPYVEPQRFKGYIYQVAIQGRAVRLVCEVSGYPSSFVIEWYFNGRKISGRSSSDTSEDGTGMKFRSYVEVANFVSARFIYHRC